MTTKNELDSRNIKLPEDIKKKWVTALRSGKYEQGEWYLNCEGVYCCLGVLCEVLKVPRIGRDEDTDAVIYGHGYDVSSEELPEYVSDMTGLSHLGCLNSPVAGGKKNAHHESLSSLNDTGMSFDEIADVIEAQF